MNVLVIDVGGQHVKILLTGQKTPRKFESGPKMTVEDMVEGVRKAAEGWTFDVVFSGLSRPSFAGSARIRNPRIFFAPGWVGFDFEKAFGCPVKVINDAAMQALGSYQGGRMLFLGLGTGLGSGMIVDGVVEPLELAHLPYRKGTFEDYVGERGLEATRREELGDGESPRSSRRLRPHCKPPTSLSVGETSRSSRNYRRTLGRVTMTMHLPAGSGSGTNIWVPIQVSLRTHARSVSEDVTQALVHSAGRVVLLLRTSRMRNCAKDLKHTSRSYRDKMSSNVGMIGRLFRKRFCRSDRRAPPSRPVSSCF